MLYVLALKNSTQHCVASYPILYPISLVLYREWVNLAIVSGWHLVLWTTLLNRQGYIVASLSSDKCTYCKSLWIKASAKRPECKCHVNVGLPLGKILKLVCVNAWTLMTVWDLVNVFMWTSRFHSRRRWSRPNRSSLSFQKARLTPLFVLNPGESNADADTLNQEVCFRTPPYSNTLTFKLPVRFRIRLLFWRRPPHSEIVRVSVGVKRRVRSEVRPYTPISRCCLNLKEALIYCQYNNVLSIIKPSELIDHMN